MCFSNTTPNMGKYWYTFIIYTPGQWTAVCNTAQAVSCTKIGTYAGNVQAKLCLYEASYGIFMAYKRHKDTTI